MVVEKLCCFIFQRLFQPVFMVKRVEVSNIAVGLLFVLSQYWLYLQTKLMDKQLKELRRILKPGLTRLNWYTLGIVDFAVKCTQVTEHILIHLDKILKV